MTSTTTRSALTLTLGLFAAANAAAAPIITSISPSPLQLEGGQLVTVSGTGFLGDSGAVTPFLFADGALVNLFSFSATELQFISDPYNLDLLNIKTQFTMEVLVQTTVSNGEILAYDPTPSVAGFSQSSGLAGGDTFDVTGSNFEYSTGTATIGGVNAIITSSDFNSLTLEVPEGLLPGTYDVVFTSGTFGTQSSLGSIGVVPEPGSVALLGGLGVLLMRRRRGAC